jgi:hypothetical protein
MTVSAPSVARILEEEEVQAAHTVARGDVVTSQIRRLRSSEPDTFDGDNAARSGTVQRAKYMRK